MYPFFILPPEAVKDLAEDKFIKLISLAILVVASILLGLFIYLG